jgi:large subunit ribosomal protein L22
MAKRIREKAAKRLQEKDTRPSATAKYIRMGSSKAKRVLDLIRGLNYNVALATLQNTPSTSTLPVIKVLNSAAANAENNKGMNKDDLIVAECFANPGPTLKRGIWRAKGGHDTILKRTCHITIVLDSVK